ncbi:MAG: sigma-54-dependent Fis family transcriptional regulator, partial [Thermoanaerobaculia bacterium]|nr:sigma-54-dependent Fis family transcriptional regulator [Thermoanaerobaculia bacterium]
EAPVKRRRPAEIGAEELEAVLRAYRFEPAAAAEALGITRPSLYYLIRQHPTLKTAEDLEDDVIAQVLERNGGNAAAAAQELEVSARALRRRLGKLT